MYANSIAAVNLAAHMVRNIAAHLRRADPAQYAYRGQYELAWRYEFAW